MEIILQNGCKALTGRLDSYTRYSIQQQGNRFFAKRNSKGLVPPDGHWRFICICAEQAGGIHIANINVTAGELDDALEEATNGRLQSPWAPRDAVVNADKVLQLKHELGL